MILVFVISRRNLQNGQESFLRDIYLAYALHTALALFLLFEELAFAGDVTTVALGENVFAHGGNGFEGIAFLINQFRDAGLADPADPNHGIDLKALALRYVEEYARYKSDKKTVGSLDIQKIPGGNHPVFKDRPINHDPREVYVRELFAKRGEYNVFHEYYHALVQALFDTGVSRNVYCVNIDAVIAARRRPPSRPEPATLLKAS